MMFSALLFWWVPVGLLGLLFERKPKKVQWSVTAVIFALGFVPLGPLLLLQHWMSFAGHLSVTAIVWVAWRFWQRQPLGSRSDRLSVTVLTTGVLLFYTLALGFSLFDPYRFGFSQPIIPIALIVSVGLFALWRRYRVLPVMLMLALLAYAFKLLPSDNVWDYVLDPIVLIMLIVQTIRLWLRKA